MTKKRFTETTSTGIVTDNQTKKEYNCEMRIDDDFLNLVNIIAEENEELKQSFKELLKSLEETTFDKELLEKENEQLKQLVNIADDLIDKLGSETMQNEWIKNF